VAISARAWSIDSHSARQAQRFLNWPNHDSINGLFAMNAGVVS